MSIFDNKNVIEITKDDINDASLSSKSIDQDKQKRAFANVLGARLGIKFLHSIDIKADNYESLYTIPAVLKDMDISDICVDNIKIDVRIAPDENQLFVPKSQFEFNVTPDIYIFIKISPDFSYAEFIGAISPEEIKNNNGNKDYFYISKDDLYNEKSLKNVLQKSKPKSNMTPSENEILKAESFLVNFIDGDILNNEKHFLYEQLTNSPELRRMFKDFEHFELISTDLAHTDEILSDSVLDVLGAQQIYKNDLSEGEFDTSIDLDEIADATVADFVEDFIDEENKDNNMLEDENIIEGEFEELPEDTDKPVEEPGELEKLPSDEELASFADFNEFENINNSEESEVTLDDFETIDLQNSGFEGFEGLEANNDIQNENALEDINLDEFSLNDNEAQLDDTNVSASEIDLGEVENLDNIENIDFSEVNLDDISNNTELPELEDITPTEDLISIDNLSENISENNNNNIEEEKEEIQEEEPSPNQEQGSLLNAVQQEGMEINGLESLEQFEAPIDLTLPELEPDADLPMLEPVSDSDNVLDTTVEETKNPSLDDIAESINFSEPTSDTQENLNIEEVSTNSETDIATSDELNENIPELQPQLEETQDIQEDTSNNEEDDFSGLEEFTMDMAAAVEQANPNINNPMAMDENIEFNNFEEDSPNNSMDFNILDSNNETQLDQNTQDSETSSDIDLNNFNLDDYDDIDDDNDLAQSDDIDTSNLDSELDNLVNNQDFNLDDINLDDLDLDDENLSLDDINLDKNNYSNEDTTTSLNDIPELSDDNNIYSEDLSNTQQPQNESYNDYSVNNPIENNDYAQQNMNYDNQEQYNPDFGSNDEHTIEQLYDDNPSNQIPGEAINQSFTQNNVNNSAPKQQKKKKTSPLLGILLIVLVCALGYMKKDFIIDKFNTNKGINYEQDQNMPIEGETQEDKENEKLLNDTTDTESDMQDEKQGIGAIPGEAGGPQDVKSMTESLKQASKMPESISNAYPKTPEPLSSSSLKRLYWEIPQDLTYNDAIVNYLKIAGRTMKFSIQSDLLNASELPYSNKMIVDIKINKSGEVEEINTTVSSGSKQIDSIVLQSVKAALKYVKAPTAEFKSNSYNFSLIINF